MAAITHPDSIRFPHRPEPGDHLLTPLRWCGDRWSQLCTIGEDGTLVYKTAQIALRAIPVAVLALATFFSVAIGAIGSLTKSLSSTPRQDWKGQYIEVAMDAPLKQRCQEMGINNTDLENYQIGQKVRAVLPNDLFASIVVNRDLRPFPGKIAKVITLSTGLSFLNRNIFSGLYEDLSGCFGKRPLLQQEKVYSVDGLQNFLLGKEITSEQRIALINVIKSTDHIELAISEDLNHLRIILV